MIPSGMLPAAYRVIVVCESDELRDRSHAAVVELGDKLRVERSVRAAARRFANDVARTPDVADVAEYEVVGFCTPVKDRPDVIEPIVIHEGHPKPIRGTFDIFDGEYRVAPTTEFEKKRSILAGKCLLPVAERLFMCDALLEAITQADVNEVVTDSSCDPRTNAVSFYETDNGEIAKRLPKWIKVGDG